MRETGNHHRDEQGIAFVLVIILTITSVVLVGTYFTTSLAKVRHVQQHEMELSAFNAAESSLNMAVNEAWQVYKNAPPSDRFTPLRDFLLAQPVVEEEYLRNLKELENVQLESGDIAGVMSGQETDGYGETDDAPVLRSLIPVSDFGKSRVCTFVRDMNIRPGLYADVEFIARAENNEASRTLVMVVRFGSKPSVVFDSAYFINNYGWLWGGGIHVNGSVRSNGNFSLKNPFVNGDVYAAENEDLGASGNVEGDYRIKDLGWYTAHEEDQVRPTNPLAPPEDTNGNGIMDPGEDRNGNGVLDDFEYEDGYDGTTETFEYQPVIDMPYLGDLSTYRAMALEQGGTVTQNGKVVIDGVYGDHANEEKNIILVGTKQHPIVINGPVVIENDLVIKGYIQGQGTFYTGRNVHIVGDTFYSDPPEWPKPLDNPEEAFEQNKAKDLVGFAAKGSIILGDYTQGGWTSTTRKYMSPPFTQPYVVDQSDEVIGYVTGYDSKNRPIFDGDYTAYDGGTRIERVKVGKKYKDKEISRRFYESSFKDSEIDDVADNQVQHVDGILYTNHLLAGKIGACTFNGTLVSRDEAMIYSGHIFINYDIRTRFGSFEFLEMFLPREPVKTTLLFREGL